MLYKELTIGEETYKCRLNAKNAIALEDKLGKNPLTILTSGELPSLKDMITVFQATLQEYHHKIDFDKACDIYDKFCEEEGNDQTAFFYFLLKVLQCNGYINKDVDFDEIQNNTEEEVKKQLKEVESKN